MEATPSPASGMAQLPWALGSCGAILFRVSSWGHESPLPDHPASHRAFCRRRVETIGANHGVLDISTIDASSCRAHHAYFRTQAIEGFADEQSSTALTEHRSSICCLSRLNVKFIVMPRRRLRQRASPSSTVGSGPPATLHTRPWTGHRSSIDAAPGLLRCSTPPDPLNHIHNRRPNLYGEEFEATEPLGRSRCHLLVSDRLRV